MARKFLTNIDLNLSELQNAVVQNLAADPTSGNKDGRIYYNSVADELRVYADGVWIAVGSGDINSVLGTANEITVSVVDGVATISLPDTINANTSGNAATATKLATTRAIELSGDITGTANFDGSAAINISTTIAANSVALGTDTAGDYVTSVSASDGISATGTGEGATVALTNTDKGSSQNIFKNVAADGVTIIANNNDDTITFAGGTGIGVAGNATTDTLTISNTGVTSIAGTANQIAASGSTGSVTLSLPNAVIFPGTVTLNADPGQALEAATKQYVDGIAAGIDWHTAVHLLASTNISLTGTSGTLVIDSHAALDDADDGYRILLKNQTTDSEEGIYVYTDDGSTYTLTRSTDGDTYQELVGASVFVMEGTIYGATSWMQSNHYLTDFSGQTWIQFSGTGTYVAGNGLALTGNSFAINTAVTIDVNSIQTLTNKTLTSPAINNPTVSGLYLSDNSFVVEGTTDAFETTVSFTDPTADRSITFKDASGTVAYTADITAAVDAITTTDVEEGTNLYFTDERAQDAVGNNISGSNSLSAVYTDSAGTFSFDTTLATTSYMSKTSGLAVDVSALETKLVTDAFTKKASASVGNGVNLSFAVTHSLNSRDVIVNVYDNATWDTVEVDVVRTDANTVTVAFSNAPSSNAYRVVVVG